MKRLFIILSMLFLISGCAAEFLVNKGRNALRYEDVINLPEKEAQGKIVYVGGQISAFDRTKRQIELVKRTLNAQGYPEQGTNIFNERILVTFIGKDSPDFYYIRPGDRLAVLGKVIDVKTVTIGNEQIKMLSVAAEDYRIWQQRDHLNFRHRWDNDLYHYPWWY